MPATLRILEILLYSMTAFIPWLMLALYPFRSRLRFAAELIAIPAAILAAAQITADITLGFGMTGNAFLIRLVLILVYAVLCFAAIRAPFLEVAANTATVLILALVSIGAARGLTTAVALASPYSWINTVILLFLECVMVVVYFPVHKQLDKLLGKQENEPIEAILEPEEDAPAEEAPEEEIPEAPEFEEAESVSEPEPVAKSATRKLPRLHFSQKPAGSVGETAKRLQTVQYGNLLGRIEQTRQMCQDLDLQTKSMIIHLNNKDYDKLRASLAAVQEQFPAESAAACCEQTDLNAVLVYFLRRAERCGIKMTTSVQLAADTPIDPRDLTVLIGNLLDNAMDACQAQTTPDRRITISGNSYGQALRFVVENTYQQPVQQNKQGAYLSAKHGGCPGTGLEVVRAIAERYNGAVKIDHTNGIFQVSVTLSI